MKKKKGVEREVGSEVTFFNDTGKNLKWHSGTEKEMLEEFPKGLMNGEKITVAVGSSEKIFIKIWESGKLLITSNNQEKVIRKLRRDELQVGEHVFRLTHENVALLAEIEYIHYNSPVRPLNKKMKVGGYYLDRTDVFDKKLKKFNENMQTLILKKIEGLRNSPEEKGKFVGVTRLGLKALRINLRNSTILYTVSPGRVVAESIH